MVVQAWVVAPVAEVQMLSNARTQRGRLSNVDAHTPVKTKDTVEVNGTGVGAQVAGYEFESAAVSAL